MKSKLVERKPFLETPDISFFEERLNEAKKKGEIDEWKIYSRQIRKDNIYIQKGDVVESNLKSNREDIEFCVYKKYENKLGEASFTVSIGISEDEFSKELNEAIFICSQNLNRRYELPKRTDKSTEDSHISYDSLYSKTNMESLENEEISLVVAQKYKILKDLLEKSDDDEVEVMVNSFEFMTNASLEYVKTSQQIEKSQIRTRIYLDFVLTARDKKTGRESEHVVYEDVNSLHDFDYERFFGEMIVYAKDTIKAQNMKNFRGKILLSSHAAKDFFIPEPPSNPIIVHGSARLKFENISGFEIGKEILKAKKDKFSITSDPFLKGNARTVAFDEDGISAKKNTIIENNVFRNFFGNKQYSDYLGIEPSGPLGVVIIDGGGKSIQELETEEEYAEIISFSWFNPDNVSGNFSAEIRLGYIIKNGKKTPFKGGLFTGNVFKMLEDVEFSREKMNKPGFVGPEKIKFYEGKIIGA